MNKLPMALLIGAMGMGTVALAADQVTPPAPTTSKDCSKMSGQEKDKCIQATPAGPVDMQSGTQKKGKSDIAKKRDNEKKEANKPATSDGAPAQSSDTVGQPQQRAPTGEAQTGAATGKDASSKKPTPQQSKDTVGQPDQRTSTGEAQTGQQAGEGSPRKTQ